MSAGSSGARTQGGGNSSAIAPTEDAASAQIRRHQTCAGGPEPTSLVELELAQLRPARVGRLLVPVLGAGLVQVLAADRAEASALVGAVDLRGKGEREG